MKLINTIFFYIIVATFPLKSQDVVIGKSEVSKNFKLQTNYELGAPPNLYAELYFTDKNGNGIVEAEETAEIKITLTNKGTGPAQGLKIKVDDNISNSKLDIGDGKEITYLYPEKSIDLTIPLMAGLDIKSNEHKLKIDVLEHFGYDMDPAYLVLNTLEYQAPKIAYSGYKIIDAGEGTSALIQDEKLQAGELVKLAVYIQNVGNNIAQNIKYNVTTDNPNVYLKEADGAIEQMSIGEVKEITVFLSPNKRVISSEELKLKINVNIDKKIGSLTAYNLPVGLNQKPPETELLTVKADIDKIKEQVARFEYNSEKFTANVGKMENIRNVLTSNIKRSNAVAVVIGIEKYEALAPAPYAENDAEIIKLYFQKTLGIEKVVTYNSKEAIGFFFDDIFNPDYGELQKAILKGQTDLFVFYSGHGIPSKDGQQIFLFPSDGKIERISSQGYDINKFYINLEKLGAKSVTVFIDACFSGTSKHSEKIDKENLVGMKGVKIKPKIHQPWITHPNFSVFTSCTGDETSLVFDPSQTGLFTYYLCIGLQGKADMNNDNSITNEELSQFVKDNVMEVSRKISGLQTPEFFGNGNNVLVEY